MKKLQAIGVAVVILIFQYGCTKSSSSTGNKPPTDTTVVAVSGFQIINNSILADAQDTVQAIFTDKDSSHVYYYYGSFDANGKPDSVKHMVIKTKNGDSTLNISFDSRMHVSSVFLSLNNENKNALLVFDNSVADSVTVNSFYFDPATDSTEFLGLYSLANSVEATGTDPFTLAISALATLNDLLTAGTNTLGCALGSPTTVVGTGLACISTDILGYTVVELRDSNKQTIIVKAPDGTPANPLDLQIPLLLTSPTPYPYLNTYNDPNGVFSCYGAFKCSFICSSAFWNVAANKPQVKDAAGNFEQINGALFINSTANGYTPPQAFINTNNINGYPAVAFNNVSVSNGVVTGEVYIFGDVGPCDISEASAYYLTNFDVALVYTTLSSSATGSSISGQYELGSNFLNAHQ